MVDAAETETRTFKIETTRKNHPLNGHQITVVPNSSFVMQFVGKMAKDRKKSVSLSTADPTGAMNYTLLQCEALVTLPGADWKDASGASLEKAERRALIERHDNVRTLIVKEAQALQDEIDGVGEEEAGNL